MLKRSDFVVKSINAQFSIKYSRVTLNRQSIFLGLRHTEGAVDDIRNYRVLPEGKIGSWCSESYISLSVCPHLFRSKRHIAIHQGHVSKLLRAGSRVWKHVYSRFCEKIHFKFRKYLLIYLSEVYNNYIGLFGPDIRLHIL